MKIKSTLWNVRCEESCKNAFCVWFVFCLFPIYNALQDTKQIVVTQNIFSSWIEWIFIRLWKWYFFFLSIHFVYFNLICFGLFKRIGRNMELLFNGKMEKKFVLLNNESIFYFFDFLFSVPFCFLLKTTVFCSNFVLVCHCFCSSIGICTKKNFALRIACISVVCINFFYESCIYWCQHNKKKSYNVWYVSHAYFL